MSDNYLRVLWTCGMGDACTNATRPGTHDEHSAANACCAGGEDPEHGLITSSGAGSNATGDVPSGKSTLGAKLSDIKGR
jgi:hypothetical protein